MPTDDFAQLQLQSVDQTQWRYEVIRPIVLFADRTPRQRADETDTHPATVRTLTRRFRQQGMVGLLPEDVEVSVRARALRVPEAVREELDRLKALYDGFRYRELACILFITCGVSIDHKTVKVLWQASAVACQEHLGLGGLSRPACLPVPFCSDIPLTAEAWPRKVPHVPITLTRPDDNLMKPLALP